MAKNVHLFGIRHHGPGSARAVLRALDTVRPQCVLVEGPPDADDIMGLAAHEAMRPPVAILVYRADNAKRAVFYPFAEFSPEWCAIRWAIAHDVPMRFMDLPHVHRIAERPVELNVEMPESNPATDTTEGAEPETPLEPLRLQLDPLDELALAAGFDDGERWWEHTFEHRRHADTEIFAAIAEAMAALREGESTTQIADGTGPRLRPDEPLREAWMRRTIRESQRTFDDVAVVCGAWHVPALSAESIASLKKDDEALLKALPKTKTVATWIPWTFDRLSTASGYGAGIHSPGWYEHLWHSERDVLERWMTRVGRLLRDEDIDCSSAHIIEATRLAMSLAAMRSRPLADLSDIADACRAVFAFDSDVATRLIGRKLLIGHRLGEVPQDTPLVPLQQDLQAQQKRLRLKAEAQDRTLDLDLRKENDRERSEFLHRLRLLNIDWGVPQPARGGKGTFHELWLLHWEPEFLVRLIEYGVWGTTIEAAAAAHTAHRSAQATDLGQLTDLLGDAMLANLPAAVNELMNSILRTAAVAADVATLMDAFPPLAEVWRYGNVRQTDKELVARAIEGVFPRIVVGLSAAVASLNDEAARQMVARIVRVHEAAQLMGSVAVQEDWLGCVQRIVDQAAVHGLLRGRSTRLLFDINRVSKDDVARQLSLMLSRGGDPAQAAAWIEGFLSASGLVLLHHEELLAVVDEWLTTISKDVFDAQVPILRRTFATFSRAERRQIGERVKAGLADAAPTRAAAASQDIDPQRAARVLPLLRKLFAASAKGIER